MRETFVLVHGSWHGGWAWEPVAWLLRERGHRAFTPTFPGASPGANRRGIGHDHYVEAIATFMEQLDLRDVILVGHSFGGSIIPRAWQRSPERIKRLIFHTGFVIEDGGSIHDNVPAEQQQAFAESARASPDNTVFPPWDVFRDEFMQDASPEDARSVYERLVPQPYQTYLDKLDLGAFYSSDVPRSYIAVEDDLALPPDAWHPAMSSRLGEDCKVVEMGGSHEVMFTRPGEVTASILEAAT